MIDYSRSAFKKGTTKLRRAIDSKAARLLDAKLLRAWAIAVKDRDRWIDRRTGLKVFRSLALDPQRAEAHHIEPKANAATRHDVRNGVTLSLASHLAVEAHQVRIVGTAWFVKGGVRYIDATYAVRFRPG